MKITHMWESQQSENQGKLLQFPKTNLSPELKNSFKFKKKSKKRKRTRKKEKGQEKKKKKKEPLSHLISSVNASAQNIKKKHYKFFTKKNQTKKFFIHNQNKIKIK